MCSHCCVQTHRRGAQNHFRRWSSFVLSSHIDPLGDQNDVKYWSMYWLYLECLVLGTCNVLYILYVLHSVYVVHIVHTVRTLHISHTVHAVYLVHCTFRSPLTIPCHTVRRYGVLPYRTTYCTCCIYRTSCTGHSVLIVPQHTVRYGVLPYRTVLYCVSYCTASALAH